MKFLLFFLWIVFFFIFFLFSQISHPSESLFGNLFLEANFYIVCAFLIIFLTWKSEKTLYRKSGNNFEDEEVRGMAISKKELLDFIKSFFWKYIYYIAIFLFYIAFWLFLEASIWGVTFSQMFFYSNIFVLWIYFIENRFELFQDLLRVNTICISLFYIILQILFVTWYYQIFTWHDIWNIFLLYILFFFFLRLSRVYKHLPTLYSYFFIFLFFTLTCSIELAFGGAFIWAGIISFLMSVIFFSKTLSISKYLNIDVDTTRTWGLVYCYIFVLFWWYIVVTQHLFTPIFILLLSISYFFLISFHKEFRSYISLFMWLISVFLTIYGVYLYITPTIYENPFMYVIFFLLSLLYILLWNFYTYKYGLEKYFFHGFSILVNLAWIIFFLFSQEVSILKLSILFWWESLYFFFSYYILNRVKNTWE